MLKALFVFWPNYVNIMLVFPNYATFLKLRSLKNMANKSKSTFYIIKSRSLAIVAGSGPSFL